MYKKLVEQFPLLPKDSKELKVCLNLGFTLELKDFQAYKEQVNKFLTEYYPNLSRMSRYLISVCKLALNKLSNALGKKDGRSTLLIEVLDAMIETPTEKQKKVTNPHTSSYRRVLWPLLKPLQC
jgi:hypothetical protein